MSDSKIRDRDIGRFPVTRDEALCWHPSHYCQHDTIMEKAL